MPAKTAKPVTRPHPTTVYARTGKGVLSFKNGTAKVSDPLKELFVCIDGKASVAELRSKAEMDGDAIEQALGTLEDKGYIKIFKEGVEQAVPDFTEAPADAPDLDFTAPGSLLEISVREAAKAKDDADQREPRSKAAAPEAPPQAVPEAETLEGRIRDLEAALARAEEQLVAERTARESAEAEGKAAARARNEAVKALAQAKTRVAKEPSAGAEAETGSLQETLAQAEERVTHMEMQLETERETREKMVQALRESQSQAEVGRNAAEMRLKEVEIALEQSQKIDRQNRDRLKQIETQVETARRARAEAEAALVAEAAAAREALQGELEKAKAQSEAAAAAAREQAKRLTALEGELEAERRSRADLEAQMAAERESREKLAQALREISKLIGAVEGKDG
jgi:hypothetical protein